MLIGMRNGMLAGGAKPYKHRVEYIEGTGTQYIDTGYVPKVPISERYILSCTVPPINVNWQVWFGAGFSDSERTVFWRQRQNLVDNLQCYAPRSNANYYIYNTVAGATAGRKIWCIINPDGGYYSFDGISFASLGSWHIHDTPSTVNQKSVFLFRSNSAAAQVATREMRVYSFIIQDFATGDNLMRLIPVVDWHDEPCMYDEVSGELFYNQGEGHFIAGPIVVTE